MSEGLTLPRGWMRTTLGDVLHIVRGVTYDKLESAREAGDGRIPILRATNIGERLDFDDLVYVPPKCVSEDQMLRRGDIVIAASSGSISVVGKAARLTDDWQGSFGAFCMGLRVNPAIESAYVAYFLGTSEYRRGVSQLAAGSNINNLRRTHIESFSFPLAPVPEQRRIVAKIEELFSDLDAGVAALERVSANLKRYRAAVLKAAVEGRLTEEWRTRHPVTEPAAKLLERILAERRAKWEQDQLRKFKEAGKTPPKGWKEKYVEPLPVNETGLPSVPKGWAWATVDQIVVEGLCNGISVKGSDQPPGVAALKLNAMTANGFDYSAIRYIPINAETAEDNTVHEGDFFVSRGNGSLHLLARGALAQKPPGLVVFPDTMIRLRLSKAIGSSGWVPAAWPSRGVRTQIERLAKTTAGIYKVSQRDLASVALPIPPLAEQAEIVGEVDRRLSVADAAETQVEHAIQRAARLRQAILKRAFEGKLVPQDPADEPASALLERVRARRSEENHKGSVSGRMRSRKAHTPRGASSLG